MARYFMGDTHRPMRAQRSGSHGERRSKGAGGVFAAGGNGGERTLRRRAHDTGTVYKCAVRNGHTLAEADLSLTF